MFLAKRIDMPVYQNWFGELQPVCLKGTTAKVQVSSDLNPSCVEQRFHGELRLALAEVYPHVTSVEVVSDHNN
jgi:hypothetical protein